MIRFALSFYFVLFFCAAQAQTYYLTVENGFGSGYFQAGDTVHVWAENPPADKVFDRWNSVTTAPFDPREWHTAMVMPGQNTVLTAEFRTASGIPVQFESIQAVNLVKNVYFAFPPDHKGVVFLLHGTGGSAAGWVNNVENSQLVRELLADSLGVIISEAEEITLQEDLNADGKLRWNTNPVDSVANIDLANLRVLLDTFQQRGLTSLGLPRFAVGMSNGGGFAVVLASIYQFEGAVSYCAQGPSNLFNLTQAPIQFCMARFDNNENVGSAGNSAALQNHQTLLNRGICSKYYLHDRQPLYPERFSRRADISLAISQALFNELAGNGWLDNRNFLTLSTDSLLSQIIANPANFPVLAGLNAPQRNFYFDQLGVCRAEHKFFSDYNRRTIRFLLQKCAAISQAATIPGKPSWGLWPQPFADFLHVEGPETVERLILRDVFGRVAASSLHTSSLSAIEAPPGVYWLEISVSGGAYIRPVIHW